MTYVGQLSLLRRLSDSPIPSENFLYADIRKGVLGPDQLGPVIPDEYTELYGLFGLLILLRMSVALRTGW
jgi:hypothetical protein